MQKNSKLILSSTWVGLQMLQSILFLINSAGADWVLVPRVCASLTLSQPPIDPSGILLAHLSADSLSNNRTYLFGYFCFQRLNSIFVKKPLYFFKKIRVFQLIKDCSLKMRRNSIIGIFGIIFFLQSPKLKQNWRACFSSNSSNHPPPTHPPEK